MSRCSGGGALGLVVWRRSFGCGLVVWRWSFGSCSMEAELWVWSCSMEVELWLLQYGGGALGEVL